MLPNTASRKYTGIMYLTGGTRRVFTCARGKVQAGSFLGLELFPLQ